MDIIPLNVDTDDKIFYLNVVLFIQKLWTFNLYFSIITFSPIFIILYQDTLNHKVNGPKTDQTASVLN